MSLLIDTGSSVSLLPTSIFHPKALGELSPYRGRVVSVCGGQLKIEGELRETVQIGGAVVVKDFLICEGLHVPILGFDFLSRYSAILDIKERTISFPSGKVRFDEATSISAVSAKVASSDTLRSLVQEFSDVVRDDDTCVGETSMIEHDIILKDEQPICIRPRPIPFHLRQTVRDQLSKMLQLGVIEKSTSPWSSPILLVPKSNGSYRFCIDFRKLNEKSVKDPVPMPRIDDVFSQIGGASVFSTLDLLSGFWQVPMAPHARKYTAFTVGSQHYQFTKMPFGLSGGPSTFVRLMQSVLEGVSNVAVYGDDVLIFSNSLEEHLYHLTSVLTRLRNAGLVVNAKKCQFGQSQVNFLGHCISAGKTSPLRSKIECVQDFPQPKTKKQLQAFIGLAGFYRRFVPNFSEVLVPLYDLLRKNAAWNWSPKEEAAFQEIKCRLCSHPVVLKLPNMTATFVVSTDASDTGLGAVLSQEGHVVEYASRRLSRAEVNYSATDRELLAIVWAVEKWRQYLFGHRFAVFTDHRPLTYLQSLKEPKGRMARWISKLQEYDFSLSYKPGPDNVVADCLSRVPDVLRSDSTPLSHESLPEAMDCVSALMFSEDLKTLAEHQRKDSVLSSIMTALQCNRNIDSSEGEFLRFRQLWQQLSLSDEGVLIRKFVIRGVPVSVPVMPPNLRAKIIADCHGSAHMGAEKTYELLRSNAYWPGMQTDVQKFISTCERCQLYKASTTSNKAPMKPIFTSAPMEVWALDIMGPVPLTASDNRYILVATDLFTKWVEAIPLPNQTASAVARAFVENVVLRHGTPKSLLTDQGTNFESLLMKEICQLLGVSKIRTSPFHPRTDGQTERANRTIKEWLASAGGDWEKQLIFVTHAINCSLNASTRVSPFQLVYGRHPPLVGLNQQLSDFRSMHEYPEYLRKNIVLSNRIAKKNNDRAKESFARRYNEQNCARGWSPFSVGDKVKYVNHYPERHNRKFSARYRGPFVITRRRGVGYEIVDGSQRPRWIHHDEIRPWKEVRRRDAVESARSRGRSGGRGDSGPADSSRVPLDDSESSSGGESDDEVGAGAPVVRPQRNRRPPVWWKDYVF